MGTLRKMRFALCLATIGILPSGITAADEVLAPAGEPTSNRIALVIGQSDYTGAPLSSAIVDAAAIASNLAGAGFTVESGTDLPEYGISEKVSDFIDKINLLGENTTVIVYISGRFAQINGENLLLPVGAKIGRASDAALNGFNIKKLIGALGSIPIKTRVVIIDPGASLENLTTETSFSPGLSIIEPPPGFLICYTQNPGMPLIDPADRMDYFTKAFIEAMQQPVGSFPDFFRAIRVRVSDDTGGTQRTWETNKLTTAKFSFFAAAGGDSPASPDDDSDAPSPEIKSLPPSEAYKKVIALDTIQAYQSFIVAFPKDDALPNIQYNLAVMREAEVWAHALQLNTPEAYWTYINSYPDGGNVAVARTRIEQLGSSSSVPSGFVPTAYEDIPPPLDSGEIVASSSSLPLEYIPRAPSMNLPVVPIAVTAAVAAAAALPIVRGAPGRPLPTFSSAYVRPVWAAPVAVDTNRQVLPSASAGSTGYNVTGSRSMTTTRRPLAPPSVGSGQGAQLGVPSAAQAARPLSSAQSGAYARQPAGVPGHDTMEARPVVRPIGLTLNGPSREGGVSGTGRSGTPTTAAAGQVVTPLTSAAPRQALAVPDFGSHNPAIAPKPAAAAWSFSGSQRVGETFRPVAVASPQAPRPAVSTVPNATVGAPAMAHQTPSLLMGGAQQRVAMPQTQPIPYQSAVPQRSQPKKCPPKPQAC